MVNLDNGTSPGARAVWSWWDDQARKRNKLDDQMARQSLGIAEDGMINVVNGLGWKELAILGAIMFGGGWGLLQMNKPEAPPPAVQQPAGPVDSAYDVIHYDSEGNVIQVPHISERPEP